MTRRAWVAAAGALVAGAAEVWLAHRSAGPGGILERRYGLLGVIGVWTLAYTVAAWCVLRMPMRAGVALVLLLGVVLRIAALSPKAPLSDDLYRYAWDGVVQTQGIDPYRFAPAAPELAGLRDPWLWPPGYTGHEGTQINRPLVRTIYPPVAEAWFTVEHLLVPLSARDLGYERVGLLLDLAIMGVLLSLLRDKRWLALYALAPLPVLEVVQNAHVDGLAVLLTLGAVVVSERRRPTAAVAVLALATLTKLYPALLLPLLLRDRRHRARGVAVFAGICLASYLPHVLAVGTRIVGYLPGYLEEESYSTGTRYLLIGLTGLRGPAASVLALILLAGAGVWALRTQLPLRSAAVRLFAAVLLVATPVQPWYAVLLLVLVVLDRAWWALPLTVAAYPLFFASVLHQDGPTVGRIAYGAAALCIAAYALSRRRGSGAGRPALRTTPVAARPAQEPLALR